VEQVDCFGDLWVVENEEVFVVAANFDCKEEELSDQQLVVAVVEENWFVCLGFGIVEVELALVVVLFQGTLTEVQLG
jgi:hypothetical protein